MLAFFTVGMPELIVILVILLLLFGKRLPEVMRSMGRGAKEFKKGLQEGMDEDAEARKDTPRDADRGGGDRAG